MPLICCEGGQNEVGAEVSIPRDTRRPFQMAMP